MPTEPFAGQISRARVAVQRLLQRIKDAAPTSARETLVQALCDGLRSIPVPLVGSFLARLAEDSLKPEHKGPTLEEVVNILDGMQESDGQFLDGLRRLGADVEEMQRDLEAIRETQVGVEFRLARATVEPRWPALDNRIAALLVNRGGGLIVLDEVHLDVEDWTPLTRVDLSVPAAPLAIIRLKATLDTDTRTYPLFALNGEASHQFAHGLGAERLEIDLDSRRNARYRLRLRLAYYDERADRARELQWPEPGAPAIELDFAWAPGWNRAMDLLDAPAVFADVEQRLAAFADWLEQDRDVSALPPGIPAYQAHPGFIRDGFLRMIETEIAAHPQASPRLGALAARLGEAAARRRAP
ncbi:MAG TPA: hypothetical protein VJU81_04880 [Methylomirabilota bacterium]|nr:hypothetical protein [Methylomirabilota bacterium]